MSETNGAEAPKLKHQLIHAVHHNRARFDKQWFGKGQAVLIVEKVRDGTGKCLKRVVVQDNPTVRYHVTAESERDAHTLPELSFPLAKCNELESPVDHLDRHISDETGQQAFFNETKGPGGSRHRRKLHDHRWLHGSDVNLTDHYIDRFMNFYPDCLDTTSPLEMAFADIEVDPVDHRGFPDEWDAPCPISLISYFHQPTSTLRLFVLTKTCRPNPQIGEFIEHAEWHRTRILCEVNRAPLERKPETKKGEPEAAPLVAEGSPWEFIAGKLGVGDFGGTADPEAVAAMRCTDVQFEFFDSEKELILAFMDRVNEIDRPDILAYWNMSFDINTQMNRILRMGMDPSEVFTPKAFGKWRHADYSRDNFNTEPTDRSDVFTCTSYTIYIDQMLLYAQLRKQAGKKESYSLDFTLREELGEHKMAYTGSIKDLSYRDFAGFVTYGALDTVPMATLEKQTEDIALAYQLSMMTRTRIHKVMKKTVCLTNLARIFYRRRGLALSNNRNRNRERIEGQKFRGAYVADPTMMDKSGVPIGGMPSDRVFEDVVDFDASSLYPSIMLATNLDTTGQLGRIVVQGPDGLDVDTHELMEAWASGDMVEVGKAWFGMPGLDELVAMVQEGPEVAA
jgi:hypothetical protein